jgi:DNA-3-methyladenine glycosylase
MKRLTRKFFLRPTLEVARDLLGKYLVRKSGGEVLIGEINEVEAYIGQDDPACHAAVGKTRRNEVMFRPAGHSYVYFTYGMYHCLNIVTEKADFPAAVLIRSIIPVKGLETMMDKRRRARKSKTAKTVLSAANVANGPGKLCVALNLDLAQNGLDITSSDELYLTDSGKIIDDFRKSPRIGISQGRDLLWRFHY